MYWNFLHGINRCNAIKGNDHISSLIRINIKNGRQPFAKHLDTLLGRAGLPVISYTLHCIKCVVLHFSAPHLKEKFFLLPSTGCFLLVSLEQCEANGFKVIMLTLMRSAMRCTDKDCLSTPVIARPQVHVSCLIEWTAVRCYTCWCYTALHCTVFMYSALLTGVTLHFTSLNCCKLLH